MVLEQQILLWVDYANRLNLHFRLPQISCSSNSGLIIPEVKVDFM